LQVASETAAGRRAYVSVSWQEITTATAYKRDLVTTDLLCLAFQTGNGKTLEIHEEMSSWTELMAELPSYLPGCMTEAEILARVLKPAFATNATRVFVRANSRYNSALKADGHAPCLRKGRARGLRHRYPDEKNHG
jgi:hypothetical protein